MLKSSPMRRKLPGVIRPLDPTDPRNPDHPDRKSGWLEVARALGRAMAESDFNSLHRRENEKGGGGNLL